MPTTYNNKTHTRDYATTAFYLPNKDRKNLTVLTKAHVHRVVTEPGQGGLLTAVGVEFKHEGTPRTVRAKREVIVSAGYGTTLCFRERI